MNSWITLQSAERHCNKKALVEFKHEGRSPHLEDHVLVVLELDHHVPCLPVHVPRLVLGKSDVQFNFRLILLLLLGTFMVE